jgi:hypothetical protein
VGARLAGPRGFPARRSDLDLIALTEAPPGRGQEQSRELHQGGLTLLGPAPAAVIPAVTDAELADYMAQDSRSYGEPQSSAVAPIGPGT